MGASREWRWASDQEHRLIPEVDPEVAAELERRALERARELASLYRSRWGWDERDRQLEKERRREARRAARRQRREAMPPPLTKVERLVQAGWRVEAETDEFTQLVYERPPVPVWAHLAMTVATVGLWLPVWAWTTLLDGVRRKVAR
jgi:hypothetical protein